MFLAGIADGLCSLCGQREETVLHALREFSEVRPLFQVAGLPSFLRAGEFDSRGSWLESILFLTDANNFTYFIILLSQIWHIRNVLVHEGRLFPGWYVVSSSQSMQTAFERAVASILENSNVARYQDYSSSWRKPPAGYVKVNVDDACPFQSGYLAVGVVIRDSEGMVLAGRGSRLDCPRDSMLVKAHALCVGLRLAVTSGIARGLNSVRSHVFGHVVFITVADITDVMRVSRVGTAFRLDPELDFDLD
ncbi:hypothetical protein F3Y22_tig00110676pilonHSYRG00005 [Hibiscus syriacus]|uniref:RNase H type-1 domain-containing protein n=1 Tax=Hibiscus syriacus TaxID=106335 RepID=A0A6A2ZWE2_HIBSY|nr:uncharacterized protein LOC120137953 [Hibiscus syriacus]KAE8696073.1 hypothetical protein F3Y22_tig00110676pilonHSYRG00005 [Hibiscus syriacus]